MATVQRNAIRSWLGVDPSCQVILCGDEAGCREVVAELGLDHVPGVAKNEFGTPLLSSVFGVAQQYARHDLLCYVNADLILFPDFRDAVRRVEEACADFLVVGQTTNLEVEGAVSAGDTLRDRAQASGTVRGREWIDYFVFRRGHLGSLPDFAVGRPYWDQWMVWRARSRRIRVVDITPSALVVHQEHGYEHVPHSTGFRWQGPEADRNRQLLGERELAFTLDEATHRLTLGGFVPNTDRSLPHRIGTEMLLRPRALLLYRALRGTYEYVRKGLTRAGFTR